MPSSDLNHFNFNNMYWTPIQILFYHVKLFYSLRNVVKIYILLTFVSLAFFVLDSSICSDLLLISSVIAILILP
ncbi:hypothetical protein COJ72_29735 [Bacillus cereus]|nr:hypothetical protein COJ72_29735 [Bacillus cereus]